MIVRISALCSALLAFAFAFVLPALANDVTTVTIDMQIARVDGEPVVTSAFVRERLERANAIFAAYGLQLRAGATLDLDAAHAALETAADRDLLGAKLRAGVVNCFVVRSLRDVDEPERMRRGVHWHSRTHAGAHYVIISSIAGPDVLAHELGHYFGNPKHSEVAGNLMSYQRGEVPPFLDEPQLRRLRRTLRGYLRSGELKASAQQR